MTQTDVHAISGVDRLAVRLELAGNIVADVLAEHGAAVQVDAGEWEARPPGLVVADLLRSEEARLDRLWRAGAELDRLYRAARREVRDGHDLQAVDDPLELISLTRQLQERATDQVRWLDRPPYRSRPHHFQAQEDLQARRGRRGGRRRAAETLPRLGDPASPAQRRAVRQPAPPVRRRRRRRGRRRDRDERADRPARRDHARGQDYGDIAVRDVCNENDGICNSTNMITNLAAFANGLVGYASGDHGYDLNPARDLGKGLLLHRQPQRVPHGPPLPLPIGTPWQIQQLLGGDAGRAELVNARNGLAVLVGRPMLDHLTATSPWYKIIAAA